MLPPDPPARLRRSALYLPASSPRALEKARALPADVMILDLEDAVAPDAKPAAREAAAAAVRQGGFGRRELVVRVNGLDTPWGADDLKAMAAAGPDAVLVPKVNDRGDIARYDARLAAAPARTALWAMVETAQSLFHLEGIGLSGRASRLKALAMGTNDLAKEIRARLTPGREAVAAALTLVVAAARLGGLAVLDGVFNGLEDEAGLEAECRQGSAFGFDGKTLIHPGQIEVANRVFAPDAEALAHARAVVAAFADPVRAAAGALRVDGRMVERLHLEESRRLLALAAAAARADG